MENKKIVLVDDDENLREVFSMGLRQADFSVEEAVNGKEGLKKIKEIFPDLVLLDVVMPEMDGFELLDAIKNDAVIKNIPVIMLTNLAHEDDRRESMRLGATDYIVKASVTPSQLAEKVKQYLAQA